jgi:hypothetical protein
MSRYHFPPHLWVFDPKWLSHLPVQIPRDSNSRLRLTAVDHRQGRMKGNAADQVQRSQNEKPIVRYSSTDLVKVEKNLASIGFFTPSHKRISGAKKKTIVWNRQSEGQRVDVRAVILPSAAYGLPITSDQDKYLASQKIRRHAPSERRGDKSNWLYHS